MVTVGEENGLRKGIVPWMDYIYVRIKTFSALEGIRKTWSTSTFELLTATEVTLRVSKELKGHGNQHEDTQYYCNTISFSIHPVPIGKRRENPRTV